MWSQGCSMSQALRWNVCECTLQRISLYLCWGRAKVPHWEAQRCSSGGGQGSLCPLPHRVWRGRSEQDRWMKEQTEHCRNIWGRNVTLGLHFIINDIINVSSRFNGWFHICPLLTQKREQSWTCGMSHLSLFLTFQSISLSRDDTLCLSAFLVPTSPPSTATAVFCQRFCQFASTYKKFKMLKILLRIFYSQYFCTFCSEMHAL